MPGTLLGAFPILTCVVLSNSQKRHKGATDLLERLSNVLNNL